jgi:AAA+ superfamily predicted ATPase
VPQRDPDISTEDRQRFTDIVTSSAKSHSDTVIFCGLSTSRINHDKASLLASTSLKLSRRVCLVQCAELVGKFIGETEKNLNRLIAEAESNNWILFFDEADALFSHRSNFQNTPNSPMENTRQQTAEHIIEIFFKHNGLVILSITDKAVFTLLRSRIKDCIMFH